MAGAAPQIGSSSATAFRGRIHEFDQQPSLVDRRNLPGGSSRGTSRKSRNPVPQPEKLGSADTLPAPKDQEMDAGNDVVGAGAVQRHTHDQLAKVDFFEIN